MPRHNHFVMASIEPLIAAARAVGQPATLVWLFLEYQRRLTHRKTIELTNVEMAKWGVSRKQKRHALRRLEKAGLITVERNGHSSPRVTIL